jgi:hypothetical protein
MARYIQRISLLGKDRWIGWEIDGVGTEIAGLILADDLADEELARRGVKEFSPMAFETFLEMNPASAPSAILLDEDIEFRLDALQVGLDRLRARGDAAVPRALLMHMFGDAAQLNHPRVVERLRSWEARGAVEFVGRDDCYLRIVGPL